jgi:SnoaL-like domain
VIFASAADELVARSRIADLLTRRGRAADAKDPDAIVREHVPGTRDSHGVFNGTIEEFADYLRSHNYQDDRYGLQRHTITNIVIDFDAPDQARVESYHLAFHRILLPSASYDVHIGGRYLDRCERQGDRWLLTSRHVIYDWTRSAVVREPIEQGQI